MRNIYPAAPLSNAPFRDAAGAYLVAGQDPCRDKPLGFYWKAPAGWLADLNLPAPRNVRFGQARQAILLDAVLEAHGKGRAISYSRRKAYYKGQQRYQGTAYTFSSAPRSVDELAALGLLDNAKVAPLTSPGRQSTFRASPGLVGTVALPLVSFHPPELVLLKDDGKHLVPYRDTERTDRMRRELAAINEALGSVNVTLDGKTPDGPFLHFPPRAGKAAGAVVNVAKTTVYRVFNGNWTRGGRHYGPWAQSIPKEYRPALLVDGQPTVEHDYNELHPTLLYALEGKRLDGGAYHVDGWPRKRVKVAFNVVINAVSRTKALRAVACEIGGAGRFQRAAQLIAAIEDRHQAIARHFYSGIGLELQYRDSCMAFQVMRRLRGQGVVALPVHDSFIVPATAEGVLIEAMDEALQAATNGLASMGRNCREYAFADNALSKKGSTSGPPVPCGGPWCPPWPVPLEGPSSIHSSFKSPALKNSVFLSFAPAQPSFFSGDVATVELDTLEAWECGKAPVEVCRAVEVKRKLEGVTQDALAHRIGLSRPQLTNGLLGVYGFGAEATAALKAYLVAA